MEADIVPICRIRRNTSWWSYRIPSSQRCNPGAVVIIPFRGKQVLGVVWHVRDQVEHSNLETITEVLTPFPLIRRPQRELIEWLAETGVCSLSTALAQWCPRALRTLPLTEFYRELFTRYTEWAKNKNQDTPQQSLYLLPSYRKETIVKLETNFKTVTCFSDESEKEELLTWFKIATGKYTAVAGRERALYAPWISLAAVHVFDPEDITYYHEQTPYISMVNAARHLANTSAATCTLHSFIPENILTKIWKSQIHNPEVNTRPIECIGLEKYGLLNQPLIDAVKHNLLENKKVIILYNAKDRLTNPENKGERIVIPGIQTLRSRLAHQLGCQELPEQIVFDTRTLFNTSYTNVGLCVILSLDPLLKEPLFANKLHGWSDIMRLFSYNAPLIVQSRDSNHPLMHALINNKFVQYMEREVSEQESHHLPPFAHYIVCSIPANDEAHTNSKELYVQLKTQVSEPWIVSQPFVNSWRKKEFIHVFLFSREHSRLPSLVRDTLCKLPRPWRVQHNPWHLF